jgi:hypothetical protein
MAKKEKLHPWRQIEEQAFHAFREWPLWLVLRERDLAQQTARPMSGAASATDTGATTGQPKGN